jgi:hypothetical protein
MTEPVRQGKVLTFSLPAGATSVDLVSASAVPANMVAGVADARRLGVAVASLTLIVGGARIPVALDDPNHTGFHEHEGSHRWTNGAARVALPAFTGPATLEVRVIAQATRWANPLIRDRPRV